jgi:hypothetical protein
MINRQKFYLDLLECTASTVTSSSSCASAESAGLSHVYVRGQTDSEARKAFVDSLKVQIETEDYCINSKALAYYLQKAPLAKALLGLDFAEIVANTDEDWTI